MQGKALNVRGDYCYRSRGAPQVWPAPPCSCSWWRILLPVIVQFIVEQIIYCIIGLAGNAAIKLDACL